MSQTENDDDYIEEEFLVFADFQTKIELDVLTDPEMNLKVIGFEEEHPIMQVNNKMFQGMPNYFQSTNLVRVQCIKYIFRNL